MSCARSLSAANSGSTPIRAGSVPRNTLKGRDAVKIPGGAAWRRFRRAVRRDPCLLCEVSSTSRTQAREGHPIRFFGRSSGSGLRGVRLPDGVRCPRRASQTDPSVAADGLAAMAIPDPHEPASAPVTAARPRRFFTALPFSPGHQASPRHRRDLQNSK